MAIGNRLLVIEIGLAAIEACAVSLWVASRTITTMLWAWTTTLWTRTAITTCWTLWLYITFRFLLQRLSAEFELTSPDDTGVTYKSYKVNQPEGLHLIFSIKGHTGTVVPIFAYGAGAEKFRGIFQNRELPRIIEGLMK